MKVGIPREVKNHEYRVAITPAGVFELVRHGHEVYVEHDAGVGSSITDDEYVAAGATILPTADDVWATGDLILKVKEPIAEEYHRMRKGQTLFTYLHLAASRAVHRGAGQRRRHRDRVRDRRAAGPLAAAAGPDVRGRRAGSPRRSARTRSCARTAAAACSWAACPGRTRRRSSSSAPASPARTPPRSRWACRPRCSCSTSTSRACARSTRSTRATCRPSRRTPTRSSGRCLDADMVIGAVLVPGRQGAQAHHQRAGLADEAGLGARRHRHRPGRLLRGLASDHARRPDLHRAQLGVLLRRQHARRRAEHLDVRAHQRDAALRRGARQQGLGPGAAATTGRSRSASTPTTARSPTPPSPRRSTTSTSVVAGERARLTSSAVRHHRRSRRPHLRGGSAGSGRYVR